MTEASTSTRRILIVANETLAAPELETAILARARNTSAEIFVVCPALNSRLRHWLSDDDGARRAAGDRLDASLQALRAAGLEARGHVGDSDPLQALADALRMFSPDEVMVSTHPPGRSHWLERGVVERARELCAPTPVVHVVPQHDSSSPTTDLTRCL